MLRRRVLVADSVEDIGRSLAACLDTEGYETYLAYDGISALSTAREKRPDAVVLELDLPAMSGLDVCRLLRDEPWGSQLTILAVTGWGRPSDRRAARDAGFTHYLLKPVEFSALDALLKAAAVPSRTSATEVRDIP